MWTGFRSLIVEIAYKTTSNYIANVASKIYEYGPSSIDHTPGADECTLYVDNTKVLPFVLKRFDEDNETLFTQYFRKFLSTLRDQPIQATQPQDSVTTTSRVDLASLQKLLATVKNIKYNDGYGNTYDVGPSKRACPKCVKLHTTEGYGGRYIRCDCNNFFCLVCLQEAPCMSRNGDISGPTDKCPIGIAVRQKWV